MTHGPLSWRELVERDKQKGKQKSEDAHNQIKRAAMQPAPPQKQEGTDMNQIEKVARAIWDQQRNHWGHYRDMVPDLCEWEELTQSKQRELMREAKAAIAAMPVQAEPQWQGIESASPPPNTRVLLAWRDWRDGKWLIEAAPYETGERVGHYSNVSRHGSATHWMPLPTPSAGGSDAE